MKDIHNFERKVRNVFFDITLTLFFFNYNCKSSTTTEHWIHVNRGWVTNPASFNTQVYILQPRTIVTKSFISHLTGFLDPSLIKDSVNNRKLYWRTKNLSYVLARVLKNSKMPLRRIQLICYYVNLFKIFQNSLKLHVNLFFLKQQLYNSVISFKQIFVNPTADLFDKADFIRLTLPWLRLSKQRKF